MFHQERRNILASVASRGIGAALYLAETIMSGEADSICPPERVDLMRKSTICQSRNVANSNLMIQQSSNPDVSRLASSDEVAG
jgi:hypothetical protein